MTLVVDLSCNEGIILASDSQFSSGATRTTGQKIWTGPSGPFILGLSGAESSMQLIRDGLLATELTESLSDSRRTIAKVVADILRPEYDRVRGLAANNDSLPIAATVIGAFVEGQHRLWLIDQWVNKSERQGFVAAGWGAPYAEHAAIVFREIRSRALTLHQAKMLAFRVVQDAIEIAGPQVALNRPIQMATLTRRDETTVVEHLEDDDPAILEAVLNWTKAEAERFLDHAPPD